MTSRTNISSDILMKRANQLDVCLCSPNPKERKLLKQWLDASGSLWNKINYACRQNFHGNEGVWNADTGSLKASIKPSSAVPVPNKSSAKILKRGSRSSAVIKSTTPGNSMRSRHHPATEVTKTTASTRFALTSTSAQPLHH